jgi:ectoine hydroxylase-related dioxygenase (phytanoyl-CoA dioxygenase family)
MEPRFPTPLDDFLFDLRGYIVLQNAVEPGLLLRLNEAIDVIPHLQWGEWYGNTHRRDYTKDTGFELHNCVELVSPFEELIDNPGWINYLRHYCGEEKSYVEGLFIDECIVSVRGPSGHHPVHSGGYQKALRGVYDYSNGVFRCGQCNIILALTDIGPGDGATMVVPGSHKSHFAHPLMGDYARGDRMDSLDGAIEVRMNKGDALLFVDSILHGGSSRTNPGERRVVIYRYGPSWAATRFGYEYSQPLRSVSQGVSP